MKNTFVIIAVLILVPLVFAQEQPVQNVVPAMHATAPIATPSSSQKDWPDMVEVFGGYSYFNADMNDITSRQSANGWETAVSSRLYKRLAVEGNISGYYKGVSASTSVDGFDVSAHLNVRDYGFAGGPRVNLFRGIFVHALFGADRLSGDVSGTVSGIGSGSLSLGSQTAFVFAPGGGVQVRVARNLSIRSSVDLAITRHNIFDPSRRVNQYNVRFSIGPVFRFGGTSGRAAAFPTASASSRSSMAIPSLGVLVTTREHNDGTEIVEVYPGSVAALAGLHVTDVINAVDGKAVNTPMELAAELSNRTSGSKIRLGYMFRTSALGYYPKETVAILGQTH